MFYFIITLVLICLVSLSYCVGYRHGEEDQIEENEKSKHDLRNYGDKYYE